MKILVADKSPIYRLGLKAVLEKEFPHAWIAECDSKDDLLTLHKSHDIILFNQDHFLLHADELNSLHNNSIIISSKDIPNTSVCCQILKPDCSCNRIAETIRKLVPKQQSISHNLLSDREIEILIFVAQGKTNKSIAEILCLSPHTIHTHRKNILKKLHLKSASELTIYAIKEGYLDRIP